MTAMTSPSPLRCLPIPDPRPAAVRWHRPHAAYAPMPTLPLEAESPTLTGDDFPVRGDRPEVRGDADPLRAHVRALLWALVDAIQGRRPATQLIRWVSDEVIADVTLRARLHQRAPVAWAVRSFRVQQADEHVVEVSARLQTGARYSAVALRLECTGARWFCPVADFGPLAPTAASPPPERDETPRPQARPDQTVSHRARVDPFVDLTANNQRRE